MVTRREHYQNTNDGESDKSSYEGDGTALAEGHHVGRAKEPMARIRFIRMISMYLHCPARSSANM